VDPASGLPTGPVHIAKGYGLQVETILRDVINLNETDLRGKNKNHLRVQLLARLHERYLFPPDYRNDHQTTNIVNTQALIKFNKDLSGFKTMVRKMIAKGKNFQEVLSRFLKVTEEDLNTLVANEELDVTKNRQVWGMGMRELDIDNHKLLRKGAQVVGGGCDIYSCPH
jgi:hypothetical protein